MGTGKEPSVNTDGELSPGKLLKSESTEKTESSSPKGLTMEDQEVLHYTLIGARCLRVATNIQAQAKGNRVFERCFEVLFEHYLRGESILFAQDIGNRSAGKIVSPHELV